MYPYDDNVRIRKITGGYLVTLPPAPAKPPDPKPAQHADVGDKLAQTFQTLADVAIATSLRSPEPTEHLCASFQDVLALVQVWDENF